MAKDIWKRGDFWYVSVWNPYEGKKHRKSVGKNKRQAEKVAAQVRTQIETGKFGLATRTKAPRLDDFILRVLREHFEDKSSYPEARRALLSHMR